MQLSELSIRLIILFLPGIFSSSIYQMFVNKSKLDNRSFAVLTMINSFLAYLPGEVMFNKYSFYNSLLDNTITINFNWVMLATVISIAIGIIETYLSNYGCLYLAAQRMKLTTKTGQESVWDELFDNYNHGINNYIYFGNVNTNELYGGTVDNYSISASGRREILLSNVVVFDLNDRKTVKYEMKKLYLDLAEMTNVFIEIGVNYE